MARRRSPCSVISAMPMTLLRNDIVWKTLHGFLTPSTHPLLLGFKIPLQAAGWRVRQHRNTTETIRHLSETRRSYWFEPLVQRNGKLLAHGKSTVAANNQSDR